MAGSAHHALLEERWARAVVLHLRIVIAFDRQQVQILKMVEEVLRNVSKISRIAEPASKAFDDKAMRTRGRGGDERA